MTCFPVLLTCDRQEGEEPEIYTAQYRLGASLSEDTFTLKGRFEGARSALGWLAGNRPVLTGPVERARQAKDALLLPVDSASRVSADGCYRWRTSPHAAWPPPCRIYEWNVRTRRESIVWNDPSLEVVDLQPHPAGGSLVFALGSEREVELLRFHSASRRFTTLLRHADFFPNEFTISPSGQEVLYVDRRDDLLCLLPCGSNDSVSRRVLSQPALEMEHQNGYRVLRTSPSFSPDGSRIFYCTAYLEMRGLELSSWGSVYAICTRTGQSRRLDLDEACPLGWQPATPLSMAPAEAAEALPLAS